MTNRLQWDVLVSAQIPVVTNNLPPGASEMKWSPISSTLISGKLDKRCCRLPARPRRVPSGDGPL
jgi:hypothetical protein